MIDNRLVINDDNFAVCLSMTYHMFKFKFWTYLARQACKKKKKKKKKSSVDPDKMPRHAKKLSKYSERLKSYSDFHKPITNRRPRLGYL